MQLQVDILLATYNGEKYLQKQIDSILHQSYKNFKIYIRDDGSTDNTISIIKNYCHQFPHIITFIEDDLGNLGVTQNFNELLKYSTAPYIAFSDQDDIWLPHKIELSLNQLQKNEIDKNDAVFVYSDMRIIDQTDHEMHASFWKLASLHPKFFTFNRLLMQSIPHGCTILMNSAMKNLATPIPTQAILHDHWLSLVAVNFGKAIAIEDPLVLIRNHGENVTQQQATHLKRIKRFYKNFSSNDEYLKHLMLRIEQGKAFKSIYFSKMTPKNQLLLNEFLRLETTSGFRRKLIYIKNKFYRTTFLHTLKMIWRA